MKILQVTGTMNRGGAEVMIMDLYKNIDSSIHFDFLINYRKKNGIKEGDFDSEISILGGELFHIPTQWEIGPFRYLKEFKKIVAISKPDIVHIHMNSKSGVIAWAAKKAGIKNVITHSHAEIKFRGRWISRLISSMEMRFQKFLINKYSDRFWGCSLEANKSLFYNSKLKTDKSAVINNAVDLKLYQNVKIEDVTAFKMGLNINENTIILGNVGRIVSHKNVLFAIDFLNSLIKAKQDVAFVFAGRADQPEYLDQIIGRIKKCGLEDKVHYLGLRDDIPTLMHVFDVFVGPALQEGFGLVAVEAQAAGIPSLLYTGFPKSVDMQLGLCSFLSNFEIENWVNVFNQIEKKKKLDKLTVINKIKALGFDSFTNAQFIARDYALIIK